MLTEHEFRLPLVMVAELLEIDNRLHGTVGDVLVDVEIDDVERVMSCVVEANGLLEGKEPASSPR